MLLLRWRWQRLMLDFSLSRDVEKILPEWVEVDGVRVEVDADFRNVLRCIRVLTDPDVKTEDAAYLLMLWFFKGVFVQDAFRLFSEFVSSDDDEPDGEPPSMDFEQDADVIYSSFLAEYGIDLLTARMHWRRFLILLSGLSEKSALSARVRLREMDTKDLKGKDKAKAERAKRRVALKERISEEEQMIQMELQEALERGEDPAPILEKIRKRGGIDG